MKHVSVSGFLLFVIALAIIIRNITVGVDFWSNTNSLAILGLFFSIAIIYKERNKKS